MKIAIATGIETFNNGIFKRLQEEYEVETVHFQEFLLDNEFEIVILSKHLAGERKIEKLLFELKCQGKRIIFLSSEDSEDKALIKYCISYGVHDILYNDITPDKIKTIIEEPMQLKDVSHLIRENEEFNIGPVQSKDTKAEVKTKSEKKEKKSFLNRLKKRTKLSAINEKKDNDDDSSSDVNVQENELTETMKYKNMVEDEELSVLVDNEDPFSEEPHTVEADVKKIVEQEMNKLKDKENLSSKETTLNEVTLNELISSKTDNVEQSSDEIYEEMVQRTNKISETLKDFEESVLNKNKIIGNNFGIVAIVGSDRRVGVTHTSLLLAHGAKKAGIQRVAFVEDNSRGKVGIIQKEFFGKDKKNTFKLKGVDYYSSIESVSDHMGDYDLIILDLGYYQESQNKALFKVAQYKVIVSDANFMQREALIPFCKTHKDQFRNYTYILPLATQIEKKSFMTFFEVKKVINLPYMRNPFDNNSMTDIVRMIIER